MAWVRIDDRLHAHPKFRAAWELEPASVGLELLALSHSAAYLTDGHVDELFVRAWFHTRKRQQRAIDALVRSGLWVPNGDGWEIHDYLDYNPSADDVREKHDWDSSRKALERDRELVEAVKARDRDLCRYCGVRVNWKDRKGPRGGTYDHVRPHGPNTLDNVVVCCRHCNAKKGGRTPEEADMPLRDAAQ